ncbi:MAG: hypothetical protein IT210_20630 [Armatimonadetes bacterium]|nr:hypothetical protein [Armatimonadota bacterium]
MFFCSAAAAALSAQAGEVALTVQDYAGTARKGAPVRGGVPFPLGAVREGKTARLLNAKGRDIPCAVRPIARWHDGSVKWLLVDALVDIPANGAVSLRLQPGARSEAKTPRLSVKEDARQISLDTGPARFVFSKTRFGLPAAAWTDLNGDGKAETRVVSGPGEFSCLVEHTSPGPPQEENWLRDAAGSGQELFTAAPSGGYKAEIENANPLRATVKLSGWLVNQSGRRLIQYIVRAYASAGRPELRILHTFIYAGKPKEDFIRAMGLRIPYASSDKGSWDLGGETIHRTKPARNRTFSLYETGPEKLYHLIPYTQDKTVYYTVEQDGEKTARGKEAAGWARISNGKSSVSAGIRHFGQMHPKELLIDSSGLTLYLWSRRGGKVLDLRRRYDEVENTYHYDLSLWPYGGEGVGVTHEMMFRFGPAAGDSPAAMASALNAPLLLECSPQYYADSNAFGPFALPDAGRYPRLEGVQEVALEWMRHNQRLFHWDGMIDFGDTLFHGYQTRTHYGYIADKSWGSRGYVGWLCNDGTMTNSLFLQYLRTGDYRTFLTAEAMARHVMEVDTCHWCAEEPGYVGGGHRHDQQHWGNGVRGYGTATHGSIDYYLLTGDERALDVAREYARFHTSGIPTENEDPIGGLIRMWEITGDPAMKAKADELLAAELKVPESQNWRFVTQPHFRFVSNTSVSLMHYLLSAPPRDTARLREAILQSCDFVAPTAMSSWDTVDYLPLMLYALAYRESGEERYARAIAALIQRIPLPYSQPVPGGFRKTLRALDFESLWTTAQRWNINNLYIANIHILCPMPYVLSALKKAGMDEEAVRQVARTVNTPPPFEEIILPANIQHEQGFLYIASIEHGVPSDAAGGHSDLALLENGKPLGPAHSSHQDIRQKGEGRYSHWGARTVWFSASDNSDPATNGREYKVVYRGK